MVSRQWRQSAGGYPQYLYCRHLFVCCRGRARILGATGATYRMAGIAEPCHCRDSTHVETAGQQDSPSPQYPGLQSTPTRTPTTAALPTAPRESIWFASSLQSSKQAARCDSASSDNTRPSHTVPLSVREKGSVSYHTSNEESITANPSPPCLPYSQVAGNSRSEATADCLRDRRRTRYATENRARRNRAHAMYSPYGGTILHRQDDHNISIAAPEPLHVHCE